MLWSKDIDQEQKEIQKELTGSNKLPKHVAIIMDGNGRWAVSKGLPRIAGHKEGINRVKEIVRTASNLGIEYLTLYAFSIENWNRPSTEVGGLMKLLEYYLRKELDEMHENQVRLKTIGKLSSLPKVVQDVLHNAMNKTKDNNGMTLTLALSYSGRWDIVRSVQMIALDVRRGKVSPEDINDELFSSYLQTCEVPDPDFMIRTSGEIRLSNFLLWEMAYGEFYISDKFWHQFRENDLYEALYNYINRERRFGKTSLQLADKDKEKSKDSYIKRVVNAFKKP